MPIPIHYRSGGESAVASYNYSDIAEGTGISSFYGEKYQLSGATLTHFITNIASGSTGDVLTATTGSVDFDLSPFNLPKIIMGKMYFSGNIQCSTNCWIEFTIKKVSGAVTTTIASVSTTDVAITKNFITPITIPQTHFKRGDIFRVSVVTRGGNAGEGLTLDNLSGTYAPFKIHVPFKIDL